MRIDEMLRVAAACTLAITALSPIPAKALDNPLTVKLLDSRSNLEVAGATIFGAGSSVLVDVTRYRAVLDSAAVTLNTGTCQKPGNIAYQLSSFTKHGSITELRHSIFDVAARAHSMTIHQTASAASAVSACGNVID